MVAWISSTRIIRRTSLRVNPPPGNDLAFVTATVENRFGRASHAVLYMPLHLDWYGLESNRVVFCTSTL